MSHAADALDVTEGQREVLDGLARSQTLSFRVVQRARALLLVADGVSNVEIAEVVGVARATVLAWRADFRRQGLVDSARSARAAVASRLSQPRRSRRWLI